MKLATICLCLTLGACDDAGQKSIPNVFNWSALVKPTDAVPPECVALPSAEPKMADKKAYTAKEAAREDRKVRLALRKVRRDYKRCQTWAKAQR